MDKLFKLKRERYRRSYRGSRWFNNFLCNELYSLCKPTNTFTNRNACSGRLPSDDYWCSSGYLDDGFYANLPYAQAPGMGLNAFFTFTVVFGLGYSWQEALAMVFICGIISLIITLTNVRKMIIESIPNALRSAISAGIGVFLAYVGIKNAGLLKFTIDPGNYTVVGEGADKAQATIAANSSAVPGLVSFNNPAVLVALAGLAITIFFVIKGIKGELFSLS